MIQIICIITNRFASRRSRIRHVQTRSAVKPRCRPSRRGGIRPTLGLPGHRRAPPPPPLLHFLPPQTEGGGIPYAMESVALRGGILRLRAVALRTAAAVVTIGSGGFAGKVAPGAVLGAAVGGGV